MPQSSKKSLLSQVFKKIPAIFRDRVNCSLRKQPSFLTPKDVLQGGTSAPRWQEFHTDEENLSRIWSGALIGQHSSYLVLAFVDDRQTTDKKAQRSRVNVMNLLQKSQYSWNIFFFRASVINRRTQNFTIIDQEKHKIEQIYIWSPMTTELIMSTLIYVISMEFPLLRHKRPSSWNAPSHKEWGDRKRAWSQAGDKGVVGSFIYYFISH